MSQRKSEQAPSSSTPARPHRRRALKILGALGVAGLGGGAVALSPARSNAYYSGPVNDHFDGVRFFNPGGPGPKSFRQLMSWQFGTRAEAWPSAFPSPLPQATPPPRVTGAAAQVTFIGHASYLIQTAGLNILFDPVFVDRASPFQFAGPKRVNAPGVAFDALPKIDVILISHNHYDHLDVTTIGRVHARDGARLITPLGNDSIVKASVPSIAAQAVDWGDRVDLGNGVRLDTVPTQHWSARGTRDRMHALWASFVLTTPAHTIYIIGDTGFGDGGTFRHVAARHPVIDLACLPIGAYEPRWFMRDQHMGPDEAVKAFEIIKAKRAVGHHWGTFKLTNEAVETPRAELATALAAAKIAPDRFVALQPGAVVKIGT